MKTIKQITIMLEDGEKPRLTKGWIFRDKCDDVEVLFLYEDDDGTEVLLDEKIIRGWNRKSAHVDSVSERFLADMKKLAKAVRKLNGSLAPFALANFEFCPMWVWKTMIDRGWVQNDEGIVMWIHGGFVG